MNGYMRRWDDPPAQCCFLHTGGHFCCARCAPRLRGRACPECRAEIVAVAAELPPPGCPTVNGKAMVLIGGGLLAREVRRVRGADVDRTGNLAAAEARAKAAVFQDVTALKIVVRAAGDRVLTARVALADAATLGSARAGNAASALAIASPAEKLRLLAELDPYRRVKLSTVVGGARACQQQHCGAVEGGGAKFLRCGRCKDAWYCSKACQVADWKIGNHRAVCGTLPND